MFNYLRLKTILIKNTKNNNKRTEDLKKHKKKQKNKFFFVKKTTVFIPWLKERLRGCLCSAAFRCKRWVWGMLSPHGWDIGLKGWDMGPEALTDVWDIIDGCILKAGAFFNK